MKYTDISFFKLFPRKGQSDDILVAQQHRDWAKLGFIRGIAVSPVMCCSLSTPQWVSLLLRVVKGSLPDGDLPPSNVSAAPLPRQVMSSWKRFDTLLSQFSRANWVMHRERDPQISGIHFISTLMRLMRIFICDSLVIFKVVQLLSNSNINNLFCNFDLDFWFSIRSVSLALSNRRRLKKKKGCHVWKTGQPQVYCGNIRK